MEGPDNFTIYFGTADALEPLASSAPLLTLNGLMAMFGSGQGPTAGHQGHPPAQPPQPPPPPPPPGGPGGFGGPGPGNSGAQGQPPPPGLGGTIRPGDWDNFGNGAARIMNLVSRVRDIEMTSVPSAPIVENSEVRSYSTVTRAEKRMNEPLIPGFGNQSERSPPSAKTLKLAHELQQAEIKLKDTPFKVREGFEHLEKHTLTGSRLNLLSLEMIALKEANDKFKKQTGVDCMGDFPIPGEMVQDYIARTPENLQKDKLKPIFFVENNKPNVILLTDSVGTHARVVGPENCLIGSIGRDRKITAAKYPQLNLTSFTVLAEFNLIQVSISGLGAVYGNSLSPQKLREFIYESLDLDQTKEPFMIGFRLGTNDCKSYIVSNSGHEISETEVETGEAKNSAELVERISEYGQDLSVAFGGCFVVWLGAGSTAHALPEECQGVEMKYCHFPANRKEEEVAKFDEYLENFCAVLESKSTGEFTDVMGDSECLGKFAIFVAASPIDRKASGSGHPNMRDLANFNANLLNSLGVMICKAKKNNKAVTRFITHGGSPATWNRTMEANPHNHIKWMTMTDANAKNKMALKKLADWPEVTCLTRIDTEPLKRKFLWVKYYNYKKELRPGQLVKVKERAEDPDWEGEGAMIMDQNLVRGQFLVYMLKDQRVIETSSDCVLISQEWLGSLYSEEAKKWKEAAAMRKAQHEYYAQQGRGYRGFFGGRGRGGYY